MDESCDKKTIRDIVLKTAGPVLVEVFLGTLFGMVDMMMLGRIDDPTEAAASIAAVGITNQLVFIALSLVQSLNVGATAMVARYVGAKKEDRIESVVRHVVLLTQILLVLPIFILGLKYTDQIMKFIGAHEDTLMYGRNYFKIIVVGIIFQAFNFSIYAVLRGAGDTKTPMSINLKVNTLNVVGNALLIYGLLGFPRLGVTGAAISTTFSQFVATLMLLRYIFKKDTIIQINLKNKFKFNKDIIYNLVKIGVPASLEQIAFRVGILIFVRMVSSLGTVAYATHQICLNISGLTFTPGQAFGIAASSLVGRSLGADDPDRAEEYIKTSRRIGTVIAIAIGILFFFFGSFVASLYTKDPKVIAQATKILKIIAIMQPFQSSQLVISGGLRGAGDTVWTLIAIFFSVLVVRVALAHLFINILGLGLLGAWYAMFCDQFVRWALITLRFKTDKWKYISIR
ncbi:putative MATE family efflux protein [Keratinibaculum paraultunense]|uniref:Probable multidrug resistance protein NorM n=1 Tax=Keratinibaculum paraultunense TaxID=1278232 RepID=A0A4R3KUK8_9FIRM|nr:MATE family efflux transporter [Keratinibaculum paraultunense]QQY78805.1 MATE family efflux transporter [Keratinibaculum paraultunense]TCS87485.1 putative MATE family efflux protein [Keratinibaculum paraultunense]